LGKNGARQTSFGEVLSDAEQIFLNRFAMTTKKIGFEKFFLSCNFLLLGYTGWIAKGPPLQAILMFSTQAAFSTFIVTSYITVTFHLYDIQQ
jgi:hypothetical protein